MHGILLFLSGCCSKTEVFEQLYYIALNTVYTICFILSRYFYKISKKILAAIAHNVTQYATFQPAHRAMRSIALWAGWNVGEGGVGTQRPSRLNPEPPNGGVAYTVLLCEVPVFYKYFSGLNFNINFGSLLFIYSSILFLFF
jgi:hypothetical protein